MKHVSTFFVIFIYCFRVGSCGNSTDCFKMYLNNTISTKCINETACCYYNYEIGENTEQECVEKVNNTENLCLQFSRLFTFHPSALFGECDCTTNYILLKTVTLILTILLMIA